MATRIIMQKCTLPLFSENSSRDKSNRLDQAPLLKIVNPNFVKLFNNVITNQYFSAI